MAYDENVAFPWLIPSGPYTGIVQEDGNSTAPLLPGVGQYPGIIQTDAPAFQSADVTYPWMPQKTSPMPSTPTYDIPPDRNLPYDRLTDYINPAYTKESYDAMAPLNMYRNFRETGELPAGAALPSGNPTGGK